MKEGINTKPSIIGEKDPQKQLNDLVDGNNKLKEMVEKLITQGIPQHQGSIDPGTARSLGLSMH